MERMKPMIHLFNPFHPLKKSSMQYLAEEHPRALLARVLEERVG
jgi:hypothetical protein